MGHAKTRPRPTSPPRIKACTLRRQLHEPTTAGVLQTSLQADHVVISLPRCGPYSCSKCTQLHKRLRSPALVCQGRVRKEFGIGFANTDALAMLIEQVQRLINCIRHSSPSPAGLDVSADAIVAPSRSLRTLGGRLSDHRESTRGGGASFQPPASSLQAPSSNLQSPSSKLPRSKLGARTFRLGGIRAALLALLCD